MRSVLIAWELGANWGHTAQVRALARELRERGDRVTLVQKPRAAPRGEPPASYADILAGCGFADAASLRALAGRWRAEFDRCGAQVLIAESAPGALFAARVHGIPAVHLATGFTSPPSTSPLPAFRPADPERLREREARVLEAMNRVRAERGLLPSGRVAELFTGSEQLFATFPELDHYGPREGARYVGPLFEDEEGALPGWPAGAGPRVFVYLRPAPYVEPLLGALKERGARLLCVLPGSRGRNGAIAIGKLDPPPDFAITHAGHGTAAAMLLRGVPLLMLPNHVEQLMLAQRVALLGAGLAVSPDASAAAIGRAVDEMRSSARYRACARWFAERNAGIRPHHAAFLVAEKLDDLWRREESDAG